MNINLNDINLLYYNDFLIFKLLTVVFLLGSCIIFFKLIKKDLLPKGYEILDFKIINSIYNWICVFFYIIIFIIGIMILRIYQSNLLLDLTPIFIYFTFLQINQEYLLIVIILLFFILYLLVLMVIIKYSKNFLELRLLQRQQKNPGLSQDDRELINEKIMLIGNVNSLNMTPAAQIITIALMLILIIIVFFTLI